MLSICSKSCGAVELGDVSAVTIERSGETINDRSIEVMWFENKYFKFIVSSIFLVLVYLGYA